MFLMLGTACAAQSSQPALGSVQQEDDTVQQEQEIVGPDVVVNGQPMKTESTKEGDITMIAAQEFAELFGAEYSFDGQNGVVTLTWNEKTAKFTLDDTKAALNGTDTMLKAAPYQRDDVVRIPAKAAAEALGGGSKMAHETLYLTPCAGDIDVPQGYLVPILMYHAVSDEIWGIEELFVSPSSMEQQLKYLCDNGYTTITFEDLPYLDQIEKPVMLTFDDGYDDNYEYLYPLLEKYQCKATIFVIANSMDGAPHKMTADQIKELSDSGLVSIQSHTYTHHDLDSMTAEEQRQEMKQSLRALMKCTGKQPFVLCYPSGRYDENTLEIGPDYYNFGLEMVGGLYTTSDDSRFQMTRYYIARYTDLDTFAAYVSGRS